MRRPRRLYPVATGFALLLAACGSRGGASDLPSDAMASDAMASDAMASDAMASDAMASDATASDAMAPDAMASDAMAPDASPGPAPDCADPDAMLTAFYAEHAAAGGAGAFSAHYRFALESFLRAEAEVCAGDMAAARARIDAVWQRYPIGDPVWFGAGSADRGTNVGNPVAYYGLRMLDDVVNHALAGPRPTPTTVTLTVMLVGCSEGIQPRTWAELNAGEGEPVRNALTPAVLADDFAVMRASLDLFGRYVTSMSDGRLELAVRFASLPDVCVPVYAAAEPYRLATIGRADAAWQALPADVRRSTDWWMVVYPSHVPEQHPDFAGVEFISGGMGQHPDGGPLFLGDDRWFVRKPPHLGDGPYTDAERRAYLPQWLQHEFYHHLFLRYPEFGLEAESHQWFDRGTWPADFAGIMEPDYYAEALNKRFRGSDPPLHVRLRYAGPPPAIWQGIAVADLAGRYQRQPVENPWHDGRIIADGDLRWQNEAGVSWSLGDAVAQGRLTGGPDNPYFGDGDVDFHLQLERGADGAFEGRVTGFRFLGELYTRQE